MGNADDQGDDVRSLRFFQLLRSWFRKADQLIFKKESARLREQSWLFLDDPGFEDRAEGCFGKKLILCRNILALGFAFSALCGLVTLFGAPGAKDLVRPRFGEPLRHAVVDVQGEYHDVTISETWVLRLPARLLTPEEEHQRLRLCAKALHDLILGENSSLLCVKSDLSLIRFHEETGVSLAWESSDPNRIGQDGTVDLLGAVSGETVRIGVDMSLGASSAHRDYTVAFAPARPEDVKASLRRHLSGIREELSRPGTEEAVTIPDKTEEGILLSWRLHRSSRWLLPVPVVVMVAAGIYLSRFDGLKRKARRRRKDVEEELPNLSLQLTLLLNAGLVVTSAFDELLQDCEGSSSPLYRILGKLRMQCIQTNESFVNALHHFAQRTGSRDFLRLAVLIVDHSSRGSELACKLERERIQLWEGRLLQAQSRAREVETKLCLPLMLLLCVIVVIAVAPALMEM